MNSSQTRRAVPDNTLAGICMGGRNLLRPLHNGHKRYLAQDVVLLEWAYTLDQVTVAFLRRPLRPCFTELPRCASLSPQEASAWRVDCL